MYHNLRTLRRLVAVALVFGSAAWSISGVSAQMPPCTASTPAGGGTQGCVFTGSPPGVPQVPEASCVSGAGAGGHGCLQAGSFPQGQTQNCAFAAPGGAPPVGGRQGPAFAAGSAPSGAPQGFMLTGQGAPPAGVSLGASPFAPAGLTGLGSTPGCGAPNGGPVSALSCSGPAPLPNGPVNVASTTVLSAPGATAGTGPAACAAPVGPGGGYCTLGSGGQVWVPAGAPSSGYGC
jgi:hypothetical protein